MTLEPTAASGSFPDCGLTTLDAGRVKRLAGRSGSTQYQGFAGVYTINV